MRDLLSWAEADQHFARYKMPIEAVPTPFPALNRACRGFGGRIGPAMGWYVVIGGDTGQGKSLLALQLGCEAVRHGVTAGFISLEMSEHELRNRFYSQFFGVDSKHLEPGPDWDPAVEERVKGLVEKFNLDRPGKPYLCADDVGTDVLAVVDLMHEWLNQGCRMMVVDYLQLCESPDQVGMAREVQAISKAMRDFAHQTDTLVIGLSQYNNEGGNDRTRSPQVGHLYGGRRISQDSDMTLLLDHSRYASDPMSPWIARSYLTFPKNRHGPKGFDIPLEWDYRTLTAREAQPDELHLWPDHEKPTNGRR